MKSFWFMIHRPFWRTNRAILDVYTEREQNGDNHSPKASTHNRYIRYHQVTHHLPASPLIRFLQIGQSPRMEEVDR